MSRSPLSPVLALLRAHARIEEQFGNALGSIHGLALKELLLMMHLERAPKLRLSRIDPAQPPARQPPDGDAQAPADGEARHGRPPVRSARRAAGLCRADRRR